MKNNILIVIVLAYISTVNAGDAKMINDINRIDPNSHSMPEYLTVNNNKLYFSADNGVYGKELWVYDGNNAPVMLADIYTGSDGSKPECLTMFNGRLYFSAEDGTYGKELWVYEHYYAPNIVADIRNGISGSNPGDLTVFNN